MEKFNKDAITKRLKELSEDKTNKSKTAQLREIIDQIEATIAAGVPHSTIVETLTNNGIEISINTFRASLKRIRKKKTEPGKQSQKTKQHPLITRKNDEPIETEPVQKTDNSHSPTLIDDIIKTPPNLEELTRIAKNKKDNN